MSETYEGPVCYVGESHESEDGRPLLGGWHYTAVASPSGGDMPGDRLVLEDDGSYRLAEDDDLSHHERHHRMYKTFVMGGEDGGETIAVTPDQMEQIRKMLGK